MCDPILPPSRRSPHFCRPNAQEAPTSHRDRMTACRFTPPSQLSTPTSETSASTSTATTRPRPSTNFVGLATGEIEWTHPATGQKTERPALRRRDLPPHHQGLHAPGRRPARPGRRRARLRVRRRDPPRAAVHRAVPARHGERRQARRPRHQRLAVLHHDRPDPVAQRQAHDLRRRRRRRRRSASSTRSRLSRRTAATSRSRMS